MLSAGPIILALLVMAPGPARAESRACRAFVGTYLVTVLGDTGGVNSRSLIVFSADGTFGFINSNQGGIESAFDPFTDAAGSWSCRGKGSKRQAYAVALDFTLPGTLGSEQAIARLDFYDVTVDRWSGTLKGSATLRFFPLDGEPLTPPANTAEPFSFEGRRVSAGSLQEPN